MPIYEFYCASCHTIFNFFTPTSNLERQPTCPKCQRPDLERKPSRFATLRHRAGDDEAADPLAHLDDARLAGAVDSLLQEMGGVDEDDPRAMVKMMRRFGELTGLEMGERMEEMVQRMEAGEDPESLESEMEASLGDDDEGLDDLFRLKKALRASRRPKVDEELYFL